MRDAIKEAARASLHLLGGAVIAILCHLMVGVALFTACLTVTVIGAGVLPECAAAAAAHAAGRGAGPPPGPASPSRRRTFRSKARSPRACAPPSPTPGRYGTWSGPAAQLLYGMVLWYASLVLWVPALLVDGVVTGLAGRRPVALPLIGRLIGLSADWSRTLLTPAPSAARDAALAARIEQLTATRAGAVAAHGAELRRIERDLHDGAQARLVALSMRIGLARRAYDSDPAAARALLDDAQTQAEEALAELRHVVRGIHPPILTDRGLTGAVRALAASSGLEVEVSVTGLADHADHAAGARTVTASADHADHAAGAPAGGFRAPAAVEAAAYFVVAEALTNAAKHSGAARASVALSRAPGALRVRVADEGRGGAEAGERAGSGLTGMRRRVAALDGTVGLTSPEGGPTVIEVELPCVW